MIDWAAGIRAGWEFGEQGAMAALEQFRKQGLPLYESGRGRADLQIVSRLSPYLRFGNLSPRDLYWLVKDSGLGHEETKTFGRRLYWRDLAVSWPGAPNAERRRRP